MGDDVTAPGWYADPSHPGVMRWWDGASWTSYTRGVQPAVSTPAAGYSAADAVQHQHAQLLAEITELTRLRDELKDQVVETRDVFLLQEVGIYRYAHPLESSPQFKSALAELDERMEACVKASEAVSGTKKWVINGSEKDGAKMVAEFSKLMLRAYNNEADSLVRTMKPYARDTAIERLQKLRASISKLGRSMQIEITDRYHDLRVRELELTADYLAKVAEEKEREREERARLKEEEAARRDFEREQARLEKERSHYEAALAAMRANGDTVGTQEAEAKISEIQSAIDGVLERAANVRAGYVYVISNIGSFGERVVKIGLTRRLEPMDRVRELGDASVPFRFDVHALIFSQDAVGLETALHRRFAERRLNLVNAHREFFFVTPQDVRDALVELQGNLLTFRETPEALEWHQSESTRRANGWDGGAAEAPVNVTRAPASMPMDGPLP